tara:strand:+ start:81 stop:302 length:222 start_codon:yes stop_codon:yes gene_type:complete
MTIGNLKVTIPRRNDVLIDLRSIMATRQNYQFYGSDDFQQVRAMVWRARYIRKSGPKSGKTETFIPDSAIAIG